MKTGDINSEIREGRTVSKTLVESAHAEILAKKEENLKTELIQSLTDATYKVDYRRLSLRRARALEKIEEDAIASTGANLDKLSAGGITPEEWKTEENKIEETLSKAKREVSAEYDVLLRQLNKNNSEVSYRVSKDDFR